MRLQRVNLRKTGRQLDETDRKASVARERLRKRYRPDRVQILFVGEAPPASGGFSIRQIQGSIARLETRSLPHSRP